MSEPDGLLLAVPSRGRPGNIERLANAMAGTCRGDTTLVVGLDEDDPALPEYLRLQEIQGWEAVVLSGLRSVVPWMNRLILPRADAYIYTGSIGDDNVPSTVGWDVRIMEALEGAPFAFGNDLYPTRPPGTLCCHVFCRSEVVRRLGYFGPPSIRHMYVDVVWMAWGIATGIDYLHDVIIEHRHYTVGAPFDESYAVSQSLIPADLNAYHTYCAEQLNADIARIDPDGRPFTPESLHQFNVNLNIPPRWGLPVG